MKLYAVIDGKEYGKNDDSIVTGATFSEEYNETLDSGSLIVDQVDEISELEPYDDVYIYDLETSGQKFYKHMLVDSFQEELNNVRQVNYKYKISLFSETKRLEKVICPNFSITQPIDKTQRRSVYDYLEAYLNLYSPKIKVEDNDNDLPSGYKRVEYIEGTGTQWIDTGYSSSNGAKFIAEISSNGLGTSFGSHNENNPYGRQYVIFNQTSQTFEPGYGDLCPISSVIFKNNRKYFIELSTVLNNAYLKIDGTQIWADTSTQQLSSHNYGIFALPEYSKTGQYGGRLYSMKIYTSNNVLVRDFVPCIKEDTKEIGLYDKINNNFYANQGTGDFKYAYKWKYEQKYVLSNNRDISIPVGYEELLYLESTGTQYINTGVVYDNPNMTGSIEFEAYNYINGGETWFFGSVNEKYNGIEAGVYNDLGATKPYFYNKRGVSYSQKSALNMRTIANFKSTSTITNQNFYLFARNVNGYINPGYARIYRAKIKSGNTLLKDFIPMLRKSDGVVGLYDIINNEFYTNDGFGAFKYKKVTNSPKGHLSVKELFQDVDAPEISMTNPTLRDALNQLMLVKDCTVVVHDDVIDYLDISKRNGTFKIESNLENEKNISYIHGSMNSGDYSTEARREYSGALSQDKTCRMVEYLGFRNSNVALMKIDDMVLETRFPVYKINKLYLCYYKKIKFSKPGSVPVDRPCLIKHDISSLIVQNAVKQSLIKDPTKFETAGKKAQKIEDLAGFDMMTIGYDIGSTRITGWGNKLSYKVGSFLWFNNTSTVLQNIINFCDEINYFGERGSKYFCEENESIAAISYQSGVQNIETGGVYNNDSINQKAVFFEMDYDAMFGGALVHSKDFKNNDDLMTADNCSSSLTITEVDGLFEKEKMNRLGNKQYTIEARYDSYDEMIDRNHILGSVYGDDVVIYHKEYQIYDNYIKANYTGTFDYVLKNYFTSVFAKLRTYNLASYGESIVRAENYKEYVVLSEDKDSTNDAYKGLTYEKETLMNNFLDKYISCFNLTPIPTSTYSDYYKNKINFAFIQNSDYSGDTNESKAFSDINAFCSGYSLCINLKTYDNVTNGVYIKTASSPTKKDDGSWEETTEATGSLQEWAIAVPEVEDAFQEKMAFGFGHLLQTDDNIPSGKQPFIPEKDNGLGVANIYNARLLYSPWFNNQPYLSTMSNFNVKKEFNIFKDNKEIIDFTFQFEPITYSENIFFSQWFTKLNDMSGNYKKWFKTGNVHDENDVPKKQSSVEIMYGGYLGKNNHYIDFFIRIPKDFIDGMEMNEWGYIMPEVESGLFIKQNGTDTEQSKFKIVRITPSDLGYIRLNVEIQKSYRPNEYSDWTITNFQIVFKEISDPALDPGEMYEYKGQLLNDDPLLPDYEDIIEREKFFIYIKTKIVNEGLILIPEKNLNFTKNMFAIVSSEKIKKEIIYDVLNTNFVDQRIFKVEEGTSYTIDEPRNAGEDFIFKINFVSKNTNFIGITFDNTSMYYINENEINVRVCDFDQGAPYRWLNSEYKYVKIVGGDHLTYDSFLDWFESVIDPIKYPTKSGVTIPTLPEYMKIINTDDENNECTTDTYISFSNLFSFDNAGAPAIHVGNNSLSNYETEDFKIKSIQFWYLDNGGDGTGKLHFVFGVNVDNSYTKDVCVSVATRRAPFVFSADHKKIVGTVKRMSKDNYIEENLFDYYPEEE